MEIIYNDIKIRFLYLYDKEYFYNCISREYIVQ